MKRQTKIRLPAELRPLQPTPHITRQTTETDSPPVVRQIDPTTSLTPAQVMHLQHERGNQFVLGLLRGQPAQTLQRAPGSALDAQTTQAERKELRVLTAENVTSFTPRELKAKFSDKAKAGSMFDDVQYDSNIKDSLKVGLQVLAAEIYNQSSFHENTLTNIPLDLTPFGGVNGVYRFSLIGRKTPPKTRLIIEQVSSTPPTQLNSKQATAQEARFQQFGFQFGTGFTGTATRNQLFTALSRVPDAVLEHARGVTFSLSTMNPTGANGEPGHYDPNTHAIEFFANALNTMSNSADGAGTSRFIFAVMHELGHAMDFEAFSKAKRKVAELTQQLKDAQLEAKRATVDVNAPIGKENQKADEKSKADKAKIDKLKQDLNTAQAALQQIGTSKRSDSTEFKNTQGKAISNYGATAPVENYAELFSIFVLDPDLLKSTRPEAFEYFSRTLR